RRAAEAAGRGKSEIREVLAADIDLRPQAIVVVHVMDRANIDPRAVRLQVLQRCKKGLVGTAESREVQEIDTPAGLRNRRVEQQGAGPKVRRLTGRPAIERSETGMIAERDFRR